jgi:hypothetical protein
MKGKYIVGIVVAIIFFSFLTLLIYILFIEKDCHECKICTVCKTCPECTDCKVCEECPTIPVPVPCEVEECATCPTIPVPVPCEVCQEVEECATCPTIPVPDPKPKPPSSFLILTQNGWGKTIDEHTSRISEFQKDISSFFDKDKVFQQITLPNVSKFTKFAMHSKYHFVALLIDNLNQLQKFMIEKKLLDNRTFLHSCALLFSNLMNFGKELTDESIKADFLAVLKADYGGISGDD